MTSRLTVHKIPLLNTLVIKEEDGHNFFISVPGTIIISPISLGYIIKFLVVNKYLSYKVLEGILDERKDYD